MSRFQNKGNWKHLKGKLNKTFGGSSEDNVELTEIIDDEITGKFSDKDNRKRKAFR